MACALLKRQDFLADTQGYRCDLFYVLDREKREVDFLTTIDHKPEYLIEVKSADEDFSPSLRYFAERIPVAHALQLVQHLHAPKTNRLGSVQNAALWLAELEA